MKKTEFLDEYFKMLDLYRAAKDEEGRMEAKRIANGIVHDARGTICSYLDKNGGEMWVEELGFVSRDGEGVLRIGTRICTDMEVLIAAGVCPRNGNEVRNENGELIGKVFYGVLTTLYGDGRPGNVSMIEPAVSKEKPEDTVKCTPRADYYTDWFNSYEEACEYYAETKRNI